MIYLQGLNNLQLSKVADYLDPIIRDESQNEDIRFLAIWATMPSAHTRAEKVFGCCINTRDVRMMRFIKNFRHTKHIGRYWKIEMHHYHYE